ncbi:hypothetical protein [Actinoplanes utahensis]|uniref:Uncharacterized protein n=1 Tax=Actinoplanes utahensis TaxID=1869 RepID=A0A0A6USP7_ACTUT|nr:hypothetical protein [Actinoplanes utahensis]KHD77484.1 hypothetical protein MB27_10180 [Actinoplanes utahensis]GIF32618.1 hypothetical protein Aut01nite_56040 [Actinoplanes utahensis]
MATIVYVHGNGNKIPSAPLKRQWDQALFGRDMGTASRMAYWAPVSHARALPPFAADEVEQLPETTPETTDPPETFVAGVMREVDSAGPQTTTEHLESWLRDLTYTADALIEGENTAPPVTSPFEALPLPRALRRAAFREMVKRTFKDVYAYFFGGRGDAMRQVVREALSGAGGPVVVIGHSLGSIIAYDVLREQGLRDRDVPLLVTAGSPLGVTEVQDLVARPLQVPSPVRSWRNVSDFRDLVALDHTIRPEFSPADRCADFSVTNTSWNHHGIGEYLSSTAVRRPVLEIFRE